ncbi:WD repeat-containing protein 89 [Galdieria sulphuraria]|nr:WD repeat-containing protein 89 [Galdieria sulphuraria]
MCVIIYSHFSNLICSTMALRRNIFCESLQVMRKFRTSLYQKRISRFFIFALIGTLVLFSVVSKLGNNLQLKNRDLLSEFPTLLEKYSAESQVLIDFLQKGARGLQDWKQKQANDAIVQNPKDNNDLPRNNIQALLEDSSTSEVSSSTELYLKEQQSSDETSQTKSTEKHQTTSNEQTSTSEDKISLEVEKAEYWNQLYKTNTDKEESKKQLQEEDHKVDVVQKDLQSNSLPITESKALDSPLVSQQDQKQQVTKGRQVKMDNLVNEGDSHLEHLLEASRLQAKFGDCDNFPVQQSNLPEDIRQTWCQMRGVDKDSVQWGIQRLEEMLSLS